MHSESVGTLPVTPLLFRSATPRVAGPEIPGSYDPVLRVWAIDADGVRQPLIAASEDALVDIETSTKVRQEGDDEDIHAGRAFGTLCEIVTKTATHQETDDDRFGADARLGLTAEIVTHTSVQQEADDFEFDASVADRFMKGRDLAEITTKTDTQQESDDQVRAVGMEFDYAPPIRLGPLVELETKTSYEVEHDDHDPELI